MRLRQNFMLMCLAVYSAIGWAQSPDQVQVVPWQNRPLGPDTGSATGSPQPDSLANTAGCVRVEPVTISAADGAIRVAQVRLAQAGGISTRIRLRNDGAAIQNLTVVYSDSGGREVTRMTQRLGPASVVDFALEPGSLPVEAEFSGNARITSDGNIARLSSWAAVCYTR